MIILKVLFGLVLYLDLLAVIAFGVGCIFLLFNKHKIAKTILVSSAIPIFIIWVSPLPRLLFHQLEHHFPEHPNIQNAKGFILLGGFFSLFESRTDEVPIYNMAAGRMTEFLILAHQYPHLPIVFTGTPVEAALTKKVFEQAGISPGRVVYDDQARNTPDNAQNSFNLVKPKPDDSWVLVTSAFHMPRSVALFEKAGWKVVPYPVDYHITRKESEPFWLGFLSHTNSIAWFNACKEWAGMVNHYLEGQASYIIRQ